MNDISINEQQLTHIIPNKLVNLITLTNKHGLTVTLSDLGASIWDVEHNSAEGSVSFVLNYFNNQTWQNNPFYFGVTAGRVANRIANACFKLDGKEVQLSANEGKHQLHGGPDGFSNKLWRYKTQFTANGASVTFYLTSPDGDQGYPGTLDVELTYELNNNNELILFFSAKTDQVTPVNLTNHAYWAISGAQSEGVLSHELTINADRILQLDECNIPTGNIISVVNTALDFQKPKAIGKDIDKVKHGYDHYFIFDRDNDKSLISVASLVDPASGREMEVLTTELGMQVYSANFLDGVTLGRKGEPLMPHAGICLETHGFPDAVNHANFPSVLIEPSEEYRQKTIFRFKNLT